MRGAPTTASIPAMRRPSLAPAAPLLALALAACPGDAPAPTPPAADGPLRVVAVNYPLAYFAERIGGDHVRVELPVPAGEDPAHWTPTAEAVGRMQAADVVLANGAGYARWLRTVSLPGARLVDTSDAIHTKLLARDGSVTHSHGTGGAHSHGEMASTTWLDPRLAAGQAGAIRDALAARLPDHAAELDANLADLRRGLEDLDAACVRAVSGTSQRRALFSHPVYDYLEDRYAIDGRSVAWEPDRAPGEAGWAELDAILATGFAADVMFWEREPLAETRAALAERGIESLVFDPCGWTPSAGDYFDVMQANRAALQRAFGGE